MEYNYNHNITNCVFTHTALPVTGNTDQLKNTKQLLLELDLPVNLSSWLHNEFLDG